MVSAVAEGVEHISTVINTFDASTINWIHNSLLLADAAVAVDPAVAGDSAAVVDAASSAAQASSPGLYDSFVNVIEQSLILLHSALKAGNIPGAWGTAIISFTLLVKTVTYPLNYKQMASTIQMQNLQPKIKALQSRYQSDPQKLNEMTAKLYQDEKINPLAGCIPTLIQIPIFIALYRSLLDLAKKDLLSESFLWIPSLEGPVGEYSPTTGLPIDGTAWLFKGWTDGHPAMGWEDTLAYLSIPIILVITQSLSQKVLQPAQSDDPAQQQTQQILKFLPLMIGWFSLNVPAGLGVYWVINNLLSTAQQYNIRQQVKNMQPAGAGAPAAPIAEESVREKLKEISSTKLRPADDLKFKVGKKETAATEVPAPAAAQPAAAAEAAAAGDADEDDKDEAEGNMNPAVPLIFGHGASGVFPSGSSAAAAAAGGGALTRRGARRRQGPSLRRARASRRRRRRPRRSSPRSRPLRPPPPPALPAPPRARAAGRPAPHTHTHTPRSPARSAAPTPARVCRGGQPRPALMNAFTSPPSPLVCRSHNAPPAFAVAAFRRRADSGRWRRRVPGTGRERTGPAWRGHVGAGKRLGRPARMRPARGVGGRGRRGDAREREAAAGVSAPAAGRRRDPDTLQHRQEHTRQEM